MSKIESIRHFCHTTLIQFYPKRTLKNFKFSGYLALILMLWGGFISSANAVNQWIMIHAGSSTFPAPNYIFPAPKPYFQHDGTLATVKAIKMAFSVDNCDFAVTSVDPNASNIRVDTINTGCDWDYNGNPNSPVDMGWNAWGYSCDDTQHAELDAAGTRLVCVSGPPASESCPDGWSYHYYKKECIEPPPPPPEKNLGGCSEGPSPYVSNGTE